VVKDNRSGFWEAQDLSALTVAGYSVASILALSLLFSANSACLFLGLDGTAWMLGFKAQAISRMPYTQIGADALQGSFDAYNPAFREYFLPEVLSRIFRGANAGKVMTYSVYAGLLIFSTFVLGRSIGLSRSVALFAGVLLAILALPSDRHGVAWVYGIYNLVPHLAQSVALCNLIIACFWAIDRKSWPIALLVGITALACVVVSIFSFVTITVLMLPAIAVYGGSSLLVKVGITKNVGRIVTASACVLVPISLGMLSYVRAIGGYTAYNFFGSEFARTRATLDFASILYQPGYLGRAMIALGLIGALYAGLTAPRPLRVFAWTHIAATLPFQAVAFIIVKFFENYHGPAPLYFELMTWPFMLIFAALIISVVVRGIVLALSRAVERLASPDPVSRQIGLLVVLAALVAWNATPFASEGARACQGFSPIKPTPITELLRQEIALRPGHLFKGLAATFDGVTDTQPTGWIDLHFNDWKIWLATGNDLRMVGLWAYDIPTLFQYNTLMTPQYYLMLTDFLARPGDRQTRSVLVLTRPHERMLKLWGVRYMITDFNPDFGERKLKQDGTDGKSMQLTELSDPNFGNYSPTEVGEVANFRDGLRLMHDPNFDGRQTVVTTGGINEPLERADHANLTYEKKGLALQAESNGKSVLVLPVQFSHCWTIIGKGSPRLFRANLMQLGVAFEGNLDAKLVLRFGPVRASECRLEDMRDMETLQIRDARAWQSATGTAPR
jgi:hypothetical protein